MVDELVASPKLKLTLILTIIMLLEQILATENLQHAWKRVKQNKGAAGIDGLSVDHYLEWANVHWGTVHQGLERGYYCPLPVKRVVVLNQMAVFVYWGFPV